MNRVLDSLYGRLAIVLAVALAAGFGTMHVLFRAHTSDYRLQNYAHNASVEVRLVEQLLRAHPGFAAQPVGGVTIRQQPEGDTTPDPALLPFTLELKSALERELIRPVELVSTGPGGFWVQLADGPRSGGWLQLTAPRHHTHFEPWMGGLWVGFCVVLIGGMALLWQVHRPLRNLEEAFDRVGRVESPLAPPGGPREIRKLADQFNRMVQRLQQFDRDRAQMIAGAAHDLRAPLTRLRLQIELEGGPRCDAMIQNIEGMNAIVSQFLAFAQGFTAEPLERRDLATMLDELAAPYQAEGVVRQSPSGPPFYAPIMPLMLKRALTNLVENAIEYGAPPIELGCERRGNEVVIRVTDHGPGIAEDQRELATQAFTRLDSARAGKGHCGLGLAIVDKVARLHRGRLVLTERADHAGLVAEIFLPASADQTALEAPIAQGSPP